jgi:hypothetical protein
MELASYWSPVVNWLPSWLGARAKKGYMSFVIIQNDST